MQTYILSNKPSTLFVSPNVKLGFGEMKEDLSFNPKLFTLKDSVGKMTNWNKIRKEKNVWPDGSKPLNRAALKLSEVIDGLNLLKNMPDTSLFICLCEGPGGFMECILKKRNNMNDSLVGITLIDDNKAVPGWKTSHLKQVTVLYGEDGTGNLYDTKNIVHFWKNIRRSMFITADGGFDVSPNWNFQEQLSSKLIWCQIVTALGAQEISPNSVFILKMFDTFTNLSMKMLYILSCCYNIVYVTKPKKSRESNSERYIVSIGYNGVSSSTMETLLTIIDKWNEEVSDISSDTIVSPEFKKRLSEINLEIVNKQMNAISKNIKLIN